MDRSALHAISYGVFVVCSGTGSSRNGQICNTVFQVTADPPKVAVSINRLNYTFECLERSRAFSVSVLGQTAPMTFIGRFGFRCGRDFDKMAGVSVRTGATGCPIVTDHSVAYLECEVRDRFDCGTHVLFLGEVVDAGRLAEGIPMTYAYYHDVVKGKSPDRAPTYAGK
jgi:flavin reductase (DIM6/NTAB) family NADH-FMN oxidoreductase RutF